jgi:hypothetical protein
MLDQKYMCSSVGTFLSILVRIVHQDDISTPKLQGTDSLILFFEIPRIGIEAVLSNQ